LKGEPKWENIYQGHSFRGLHARSIPSSGCPSVEAPETDSGSTGLTGKRPRGRDYSKAERKKGASSSSPEYLSRLQEITEKQIQRSIEKGKKEKSSEEDRDIQKKRLELEAQKLSIRQRALKLEELESANKRLQMLLSTNEEDVDLEVWIMMKEQKKNCSSLYLVLSNRERFCYMWSTVLLTDVETIYLSSFKILFFREHYLFGRTNVC
jgi:hypothetical protein